MAKYNSPDASISAKVKSYYERLAGISSETYTADQAPSYMVDISGHQLIGERFFIQMTAGGSCVGTH